jgi:hypothetical protein
MKRNTYSNVVNSIGLIALLLGVFLTFTSIKGDVDAYNLEKASYKNQYEQSKEMIQQTLNYKQGIGTEELSAEDLMYLESLSDSTIASYSIELETEYEKGLTELKSTMWDNIVTSSGKQISLILLGLALIFVAKGLKNLESQE